MISYNETIYGAFENCKVISDISKISRLKFGFRLAEDMTHRGYVLPYCFAWKEPPRWAALSTPVHARRAAMSTATSGARVIIWVKEVWRSVVERASPVSRLSETVQTARARLPASAALQ